MAPPAKTPDPRFRPYRRAVLAVYIVLSSAFALVEVVNVYRSVRQMSPTVLPEAETPLTARECVDQAEGYWRELDQQRQELSVRSSVRGSEKDWYRFRVGWLTRYRVSESKCALHSHAREGLAKVFNQLLGVMDLYTTSAVQFSGQAGGAVDALRDALSKARQEDSAGR